MVQEGALFVLVWELELVLGQISSQEGCIFYLKSGDKNNKTLNLLSHSIDDITYDVDTVVVVVVVDEYDNDDDNGRSH